MQSSADGQGIQSTQGGMHVIAELWSGVFKAAFADQGVLRATLSKQALLANLCQDTLQLVSCSIMTDSASSMGCSPELLAVLHAWQCTAG